MTLEAEYQHYLGLAFAGQKLGTVQIDAMRDAFFAGALAGLTKDPSEVYDEVKRHVDAIHPDRN